MTDGLIAGIFGEDRYAAFALEGVRDAGDAFAGTDIYVAVRGVKDTVIPDFDERVLRVTGTDADQAAIGERVLLNRGPRSDMWQQHSLPMDLQSYVEQVITRGQVFIHYNFARTAPNEPYTLTGTSWLAPETIVRRRHGERAVLEQFSSKRAYDGADYFVVDERPHQLVEIPAAEVLQLAWPFGPPPARAARRIARQVARETSRVMSLGTAAAQPDETFLPIARARAGAFANALERREGLSARIKDMLFYPGADEAEMFPWSGGNVTDYFLSDRILRSRLAICRLREYLLAEFNRQVLDRWSALNGWSPLRLEIRPVLFTQDDWRAMRTGLDSGETTLDDVRAAVAADAEAGRHFGRLGRGRA